MDIIKAAKCNALATRLRKCIKPGDCMHLMWDTIFELETIAKGHPEKRFVKERSVDWYIEFAEGVLEAYENKDG